MSALHNTPFPTAAASVSNCIHKRAKRYKDHVICAPHEDYDTVAQNTKPRIKKVAPRVKGTFEIIKHLNLKSLSDYYIQHGVLATMSKFNLSKTHMYRCIHRYDSVADLWSVEVRKLKEK